MNKRHTFDNEVYELIAEIEYQDEFYAVFLPLQEPGVPSALIKKIEYDVHCDTDDYVNIGSEEVLNAVFEIFKDEFEDEFNFVD